MKRLLYIAVAALVALLAVSCKGKKDTGGGGNNYILSLAIADKYSISIDTESGFLPVQVTPVGAPLSTLAEIHCDPSGKIAYSLTNTGINITPQAIGTTTLTIESKANTEIYASCTVTVTATPAVPGSVEVVKTDTHFSDGVLTLASGESFQLTATVKTNEGAVTTEFPVEWSLVEGEDYFEVAADGKITAKSGSTSEDGKVKVALKDYPAIAAQVAVKRRPLPVYINPFRFDGDYVENEAGEVIMKKGKTTKFKYSFWPSTAIQVPDIIISNESALCASVSGNIITLTGVASSPNPITVTVRSHYRPNDPDLTKSVTVYVFDYDKNDIKPGDYVYWNGSQFLSKDSGLRQVAAQSIYVNPTSGNRTSSPTFPGSSLSGGYEYIGVIASTTLSALDDDFMGCSWLDQCRNKSNAPELYNSPVRGYRKSDLKGFSNSPSTHALVVHKDRFDPDKWQYTADEIAYSDYQNSGVYASQLGNILAFSPEQKQNLDQKSGTSYGYCDSGVVAYLLQLFWSKRTGARSVIPAKLIDSYTDGIPKLYNAKSKPGTTGWFLPGNLEWNLTLWNLPLVRAALSTFNGDYWSTCEAYYGNTEVYYYSVASFPYDNIARAFCYKETQKHYTRAFLYL